MIIWKFCISFRELKNLKRGGVMWSSQLRVIRCIYVWLNCLFNSFQFSYICIWQSGINIHFYLQTQPQQYKVTSTNYSIVRQISSALQGSCSYNVVPWPWKLRYICDCLHVQEAVGWATVVCVRAVSGSGRHREQQSPCCTQKHRVWKTHQLDSQLS